MSAVIDWQTVGSAFKDFWDSTYAREVTNTGRLTSRFRSWGQVLRFIALTASAVVTGLAGFQGDVVRVSTAAAGIIAVVATGSASVFRADQRVAANRTAQQALLAEGWRFVAGAGDYTGGPSQPNTTKFVANIENILDSYVANYVKNVDGTTNASS